VLYWFEESYTLVLFRLCQGKAREPAIRACGRVLSCLDVRPLIKGYFRRCALRIELRPCRCLLLAKSVKHCVSLIVRKNHAVPSTHNRVCAQSCFVVLMSTKKLCE
jgi:hypothetical protein